MTFLYEDLIYWFDEIDLVYWVTEVDVENDVNCYHNSLWIVTRDCEIQFSGISMQIYAIADGKVLPYILDPNFEKYLPVVPSEVS